MMLWAPRIEDVGESLDWIEWASAEPAREIAVDLAREHYLKTLSRIQPQVLRELQAIAHDVGLDQRDAWKSNGGATHPAVSAWVAKWRLSEWAGPWAQATIALSGGRYWCHPSLVAGGTGALVPDGPRRRRRTRAEVAHDAPQVNPDVFGWLARVQLGESYLAIAGRARLGQVHRDCNRLAALIDVPVRALRGRPATSRKSSRLRN